MTRNLQRPWSLTWGFLVFLNTSIFMTPKFP
jgi:hypothetical protein